LHVSLGQSCNNRCLFCNEGCRGTSLRYSFAEIEEQLDRMCDTGSVLFTAGEPTLNPMLPACIAAARQRGYPTIGLISNGRRLANPRRCLEMLEAGLNDVTISLHGPSAAIHDSLTCRRGSFAQTTLALKNLSSLRHRFGFSLKINCTLVKGNFRLMRPIFELTSSFGVDRTNFNMVEPAGAALDNFAQVVPPYREVVESAYASGLDFLSPACSLSRIPLCAGGLEWVQETFLLLVQDHLTTYEPTLGKVKGLPCRSCFLDSQCPGVWQHYVEAFGWEEFKPVVDPARREGQAVRVRCDAPCNNRCALCHDGPAAADRREGPPFQRQLRAGILEGFRRVELAGGEVLLDPLFPSMVCQARDAGFLTVDVETNARVLCLSRYLDLLSRANLNEVVVRLNSGDPRLHDELARVPGAWGQTWQGIQRLKERGISFSVRVRRHPRNTATLEEARRLALQAGAKSFQVVG
jgi:MoaA/NifB/PqqE/SkfB family radical SAM enzyme